MHRHFSSEQGHMLHMLVCIGVHCSIICEKTGPENRVKWKRSLNSFDGFSLLPDNFGAFLRPIYGWIKSITSGC